MNIRCLKVPLLGMILGAAVLLFGAPQARAVGENPTIDGDLTDLIAAVNANSGSANGGFAFTDPSGDVFTQVCSFVNGYDITNAYAYFRLKDGSGAYTPNNVQLYLGWKVTGVIGDVDGDGTADIFNPPGNSCAISDGDGGSGCASGIGAGESYSILIDLNCDGITDLRLGVSNNTVAALTAGGDVLKAVSGAFCRNGNSLEMRLDNYQNLIKDPTLVPSNLGADLCRARIRMFANAADDLLGEDSTPSAELDVPPSIKITKLPATQDACPGTNVSWTLQVCNDGICPFSAVDVTDTLDAGLTYVSDDKGSTQGANAQIRVWHLGALAVGACQTISLTANVDFPCVAPQLKNNVTAQGTHDRAACGESELAVSHADAVVNCTQPDVNISKTIPPGDITLGDTKTVTLTISNPVGGSVIDPVTVCDKLDAGVTFDAAQVIGGTCQSTLSSNTLNGDGTRTICFSAFSLNPGQSCTITYKVGCGSLGDHPDTATVTAFCKGSNSNPIVKKANSSFSCTCVPDVNIGKSVSPSTLTVGDETTVTLTVSNPGSTVLDPVTVCDKLDAGVTFNDAQVLGGTCQATLSGDNVNPDGTRNICFSAFSLDPGQSCTITYKVGCGHVGDHPDTATVIATCKGSNNTVTKKAFSSFSCSCVPDVQIGKSVDPPSLTLGDETTITLNVSNTGSTVLDPVTVCDKLDGGVTFNDAQVLGGTCQASLSGDTVNPDGTRTICFSAFSLNPGQSCTITYKVGCGHVGDHPDTATVTAFCKGTDSNPAVKRAPGLFSCTCIPDVQIGKTVDPPSITLGDETTITLNVSNTGSTVLDPVTVCDKLDGGVTFNDAQVLGGTCQASLSGDTVNPDGTRTICFSAFSLNPGQSCTITYKVGCGGLGAHPDTATVTAFCKGTDSNPSVKRAPGSFSCTCVPDVNIGKSVSPQSLTVGDETTVTLTVSNPGSTVLDPVTVCDKLDAGVSFDAAQVLGGTCQATLSGNTLNGDGTRTICFSAFSLNPGQSCTITYKVGCAQVGEHPDTATVTAFCKGTNSNPIVKTAHSSFTCSCVPDVQIGKSVNPPNITVGDETTVTLTISNPGSTVLDPVTVCDKLDAGATFNDAQVLGGSCLATLASDTVNPDGSRTICFSALSLNPGQSCTITYKVGCGSEGAHPDTATVTAFCKGTNSNPAVKTAHSSFTCSCVPHVQIGKSVSPGTVKNGEFATVTLTVSNAGSTALDNINVCDKLDSGVGFDGGQTIGGTCGVTLASNTLNGDGSRTICFTPFSLDPGKSCTITYQVSCVTEGVHPDTATVVAHCKNGSETDVDQDQAHASFTCQPGECCWLTMGGFLNAGFKSGNKDNTFGGNVGPPPSGSWEHIQRNGKTEVFNFHSHDAHVIDCGNDGNAGPCHPAGDSNFIDFGGTGTYSINGGARTGDATFTARAEDHGEPGNQPQHKGGCGTPDYYTITVTDKTTGEVVFTAAGYLDGGNVQIHDCKHAQKFSTPSRLGGGNTLSTTGAGDATSADLAAEGSSTSLLELYRPTPNPFSNTTSFAYQVSGSASQRVEIGIYNVAGRLIRELVNENRAPGRYVTEWNGQDQGGAQVTHGVYFIRAYVGGMRVDTASRVLYLR